jgi:hypothetical protein
VSGHGFKFRLGEPGAKNIDFGFVRDRLQDTHA